MDRSSAGQRRGSFRRGDSLSKGASVAIDEEITTSSSSTGTSSASTAAARRRSFGEDTTPPPVRRNSSFGQQPRRLSRQGSGLVAVSSSELDAAINSAISSYASNAETQREKREEGIVQATAAARRRLKGRTIESIVRSPRRSGGQASAERGPALLTDSIVLGGRDEANDEAVLKKLGVSHILNVANSLPCSFEDKFIYMHIPLHDSDDENIVNVMPKAIEFIKRVEDLKGRVLVHCVSGVSRSVTMCVLYLVMQHRLPLKDAFNYIYSCRPFIAPNDNFKMQMAETEQAVLRYSSVCGDEGGKQWDFFAWNAVKHAVQEKQNRSGGGGKRRVPVTDSICACLVS